MSALLYNRFRAYVLIYNKGQDVCHMSNIAKKSQTKLNYLNFSTNKNRAPEEKKSPSTPCSLLGCVLYNYADAAGLAHSWAIPSVRPS